MADDPTRKLKEQAKTMELEGVLLHTHRLIVWERLSYTRFRLIGGKKYGRDTLLMGDAELHVVKWMSTDVETNLELRDVSFCSHLISILASLCPALKHISIDLYRIRPLPVTPMTMPMKSVITVCIKSLSFSKTLHETLQAVGESFPDAKTLDLQVANPCSVSNKANIPVVNSSSSLRELKFRCAHRFSDDVPVDSLFMDIATSCPNIVSLVLSCFLRSASSKSGKDITSRKMPHLTNIHFEPFRTDDRCRFETLTYVLQVGLVTSPSLKFVEANRVQLGDAKLPSVKWSRTSSGDELRLEGASGVVPMADLKHIMSNELEGVTVLTLDRCKVDIPQSIGHPPQGTREESSLRELKFLNMECPLSQTDFHTLSEMYPNVNVTVEHESQASREDSEQGKRMPFKPKRKTSPSSPPSPTSSIEDEGTEEEEETEEEEGAGEEEEMEEEEGTEEEEEMEEEEETEEEDEKYHFAMESLPHETDELVRFAVRVQVHGEQTGNQNTEGEEKEENEQEKKGEDYIAMQSLLRETVPGEENVKPFKMECCKRVGVEGGKLQLHTFGIKLEIPPGAIDSEAPHEISLRVLTNTPNLGNSKEEMSVCFGVQCLAPDDLVLKLPVTYTIPHCAVITGTRYSSVEAVLYTGEGEYSPDAVVKERRILSMSGIPSCTITKDVLKLKINHFSWSKIMLRIKNFFFKRKKMRCRPFKEKNLALQKTPVILRAHLYDAIKGNCELIKRQEEEQEFVPAHPEQEVVIQAAGSDLKMTCYVKETVIGIPAVIPFDKLMSGAKICEPFELDFTNQPDIVAVSLRVGQIERLEDKLLFPLDFSTPHRRKRTSPQDPGRQEDFEEKLKDVAKGVARRDEIDDLGMALGFKAEDIQRYVKENTNASYQGTLSMLRDWRKKQTKATECEALKGVLEKVDQIRLADELFGTS